MSFISLFIFLYYLFACDPSQFPFGSCVLPHPQGLSAFISFMFLVILRVIFLVYAFVFTVNESSIKSSINLSFKLSKNFLEAYFMLNSALSILNFSLLKVVIFPVVLIIAGIVILFVTSFTVKLPVTANLPSTSATLVLQKLKVNWQ